MVGVQIQNLDPIQSLNDSDLFVVVQENGNNSYSTRNTTFGKFKQFAVDSYRSDMGQLANLERKIDTLEGKVSTLSTDAIMDRSNIDTNATKITSLEADLQDVNAAIENLRNSITGIDIGTIGDHIQEITLSVQRLNDTLSNSDAITELDRRTTYLEQQINRIVLKSLPSWSECTKSSNWAGNNAEIRLMDILNSTVNVNDDFITSANYLLNERRVNTVNLILANQGDGSLSGYSIYGTTSAEVEQMNPDDDFINQATNKLQYFLNRGIGIVLWLMTDDSNNFNSTLCSSFDQYCNDIKSAGFFDYASTVVVGLELDEYIDSGSTVNEMIDTLKNYYSGKIGTHYSSITAANSFNDNADILFYQWPVPNSFNPNTSIDQNGIPGEISSFIANTGKEVNCFEIRRSPQRAACMEVFEKTLAYGVGNW